MVKAGKSYFDGTYKQYAYLYDQKVAGVVALLPNALLQNLSPRRCSSKQSKQPTSKAHPRFGRRGREENFYCRKCSSNSSNVRSLPSLADAWKKKPKAPHPLSFPTFLSFLEKEKRQSSFVGTHLQECFLDGCLTDTAQRERKERTNHLFTNFHHCY